MFIVEFLSWNYNNRTLFLYCSIKRIKEVFWFRLLV